MDSREDNTEPLCSQNIPSFYFPFIEDCPVLFPVEWILFFLSSFIHTVFIHWIRCWCLFHVKLFTNFISMNTIRVHCVPFLVSKRWLSHHLVPCPQGKLTAIYLLFILPHAFTMLNPIHHLIFSNFYKKSFLCYCSPFVQPCNFSLEYDFHYCIMPFLWSKYLKHLGYYVFLYLSFKFPLI